MNRWSLVAALALVAVGMLHIASVPVTIWEYDENFFAMGVERYQPLLHHPPPPGYPLYIGFAKLIPADPFHALLFTSVLATLAGLVAFTLAFRELSGSLAVGVVGAVLLYTSPALLISGMLPQSDAGALALFGLAIWACARGKPIAIGIACAVVIGWRLQFSIAVVPMFGVAVLMLRTWRDRFIAVASFGVTCLAWFAPLVMAAGGPESWWRWLSGQAAYYAEHDSHLSRSGVSPGLIALRFIAHPWGPKWLSLPLLLVALVAPVTLPAGPPSGWKRVLPLAFSSLAYLAFALATMDPADAVRYGIPALPFIAFLAAIALRKVPWFSIVYVAGATWYAFPILNARATSDAPPAAAAKWIQRHVPRSSVILYDLSLRPHADNLLRDWKKTRVDVDPSVPVVIFADGERGDAPGVTFHWPDTDAYRKLTRQHYGAVSVIPLPASQRFRVVEGVYPPERLRDGLSWRWLAARSVLDLPDLGATRVRLVFRTPPEYPFDRNRVHINTAVLDLRRGDSAEVIIPYAPRITIEAERSFVPARIRGANNRDMRTLAVMLTKVEQLDPRPAAR